MAKGKLGVNYAVMRSILLHLIALALYAATAGWQRFIPGGQLRGERALLAGAMLVHAAAIHTAMFAGDGMQFSFALAASLMLWLAVSFYWIEGFYANLSGLQPYIVGAGVIGTLLPVLFPEHHLLPRAEMPAFRVHFIMAMLAYSLLTLAAMQALLMAAVERQLHAGQLHQPGSGRRMPPLLTLEALMFRLIGMGFILLTITLISGAFFAEAVFGSPLRVDHKTTFAVLSWLIFASLLLGRRLRGWRGRLALRWTLAGFVALVLAYFGSRFVIEVVLRRIL